MHPVLFPIPLPRPAAVVPLALALALVACGGGSNSSAPAEPAPTASLTLSGTAATGTAIAGKLVQAKCGGDTTGSATSLTDGTFSITVASGQLPCVLRVTAPDGTVLHSLAVGSGSTASANITPVSELVVANLSAGAAAAYYDGFVSGTATALTQARVDAAVKRVGDTLAAAGVALPAGVNVLTGTLKAANGSTAGDGLDAALDTLKAKLAAGAPGSDFKTALAALADTVAKASPNAPTTALSSVPSLPAEMLLQPAAGNCSALRSGRYRLVYSQNRSGADGSYDTEVLTIDAARLTVTNASNEVAQLTANGTCRYKTPSGGDLVVSQAGILVGQINDNGAFHLGLAFPEQSHALAELAGDWNGLQLDRTVDNGPIHLTSWTATLDTTGKLTALTFCEDAFSCESGTLAATAGFPIINSTVNASGGFDWHNSTDGWTERAFLYRTGGGELLRVSLSGAGGHLSFATRKVAGTLPEAGRVSEFWNVVQNSNYTAGAVGDGKNTVRSVDAGAGSLLRDSVINLTTGVTRPETLRLNSPRDGYSVRVAETVTASDGSSSSVSAFIAMTLRGTGISAVGLPSGNSLVLSVGK